MTLVETLAALTLLSLVMAACISWVTMVSRGSLPLLESRRSSTQLDRFILFTDEQLLRAGKDEKVSTDPRQALVIPTRWWVLSDQSGQLSLARSIRIEHDTQEQSLNAVYLDTDESPLGEPRLLVRGVLEWSVEVSEQIDGHDRTTARLRAVDGTEKTMEWESARGGP